MGVIPEATLKAAWSAGLDPTNNLHSLPLSPGGWLRCLNPLAGSPTITCCANASEATRTCLGAHLLSHSGGLGGGGAAGVVPLAPRVWLLPLRCPPWDQFSGRAGRGGWGRGSCGPCKEQTVPTSLTAWGWEEGYPLFWPLISHSIPSRNLGNSPVSVLGWWWWCKSV